MSVDASNSAPSSPLDTVRAKVAGAIKQAADTVGASFEYLLSTAKMESDFNPSAGASTSSARGLYQFIDQTWLATVKEAGGQLGYGQYSDAITKTASGDYTVSDPSMRQAIMKLRDDPKASSSMAAALTQSNSFQLTGKLGRRPTDAELYMAHFMGAGGAAKLITSAQDTPRATAAQMFPGAAAANRPIFYDQDGNARSVSQVYAVLTSRYSGAANSQATRGALALYGGASNAAGGGAMPTTDTATFLSMFPDTRNAQSQGTTMASADGSSSGATSSPDPMFRSLFQVDGQSQQAVSPSVRQLWGHSSSPVASASSADQATGNAPRPLDLFSDPNGTFSG
ncbi:transglycosylase SLT domain-containing protein [Bradyrhizobium sp. STM 3557]|uniref:transglycosylase SLT domain-containing protein n=1 Tax=Bradyrhizobium sp. STM 3557 TaxID=578920 RepID=UPI00388D1736